MADAHRLGDSCPLFAPMSVDAMPLAEADRISIQDGGLDDGGAVSSQKRLMRASIFPASMGASDDAASYRRPPHQPSEPQSPDDLPLTLEPAFDLGKFATEFLLQSLFPLSLPIVMLRDGFRGAQNHYYFPLTWSPSDMAGSFFYHWFYPLIYWFVLYIDFSCVRKEDKIFSTTEVCKNLGEDRFHSTVVVLMSSMLGRYAMVAAKYGQLTDAEYKAFKSNRNPEAHRKVLLSLQILSSWTQPTTEYLRREMAVVIERLSLPNVDDLAFEHPAGAKIVPDGCQTPTECAVTELVDNLCSECRDLSRFVKERVAAGRLPVTVCVLAVYHDTTRKVPWEPYHRIAVALGVLNFAVPWLVLPFEGTDLLRGDMVAVVISTTYYLLLSCTLGITYFFLWQFFFVGLVDYQRKNTALAKLAKLVSPTVDSNRMAQASVLPLNTADNVYCWLVARRMLLNLGRVFQLRVQIFTSYTLAVLLVITALMLANQFLFPVDADTANAETSHGMLSLINLKALAVCGLNATALSLGLVLLITTGSSVNDKNLEHRALLSELQLQSRRQRSKCIERCNAQEIHQMETKYTLLDAMVCSSIQNLEYSDQLHPVQILGMRASTAVLSSLVAAISALASVVAKQAAAQGVQNTNSLVLQCAAIGCNCSGHQL